MNERHEDSVGLWLENEIGIIRKKKFFFCCSRRQNVFVYLGNKLKYFLQGHGMVSFAL